MPRNNIMSVHHILPRRTSITIIANMVKSAVFNEPSRKRNPFSNMTRYKWAIFNAPNWGTVTPLEYWRRRDSRSRAR